MKSGASHWGAGLSEATGWGRSERTYDHLWGGQSWLQAGFPDGLDAPKARLQAGLPAQQGRPTCGL